MNKPLATILKNRISRLPFIDVLAGLVQTVETQDMLEAGGSKIKKFPVSYDTVKLGDCTGREKDLQPDSSKKSITYFEDFGSDVLEVKNGSTTFVSRLRMVCWLNRNRLVGDAYAEISGMCIAGAIGALSTVNPLNIESFSRLAIKPTRVPAQDSALFSRYTYDEKVRQYLRPPFEVFGIDITCTYVVHKHCLANIDFNIENNC